jgi:ribosomal protein S7
MVKKRTLIFDKYKPDMPNKTNLGIDLSKNSLMIDGNKNIAEKIIYLSLILSKAK